MVFNKFGWGVAINTCNWLTCIGAARDFWAEGTCSSDLQSSHHFEGLMGVGWSSPIGMCELVVSNQRGLEGVHSQESATRPVTNPHLVHPVETVHYYRSTSVFKYCRSLNSYLRLRKSQDVLRASLECIYHEDVPGQPSRSILRTSYISVMSGNAAILRISHRRDGSECHS